MPKPFSSRPLPALRRALPLLLAAALAGCGGGELSWCIHSGSGSLAGGPNPPDCPPDPKPDRSLQAS